MKGALQELLDRTSVSPKADVRATAAASPVVAVATFPLSDVASSSSGSVTAAGASPSPTAVVTSNSVAVDDCCSAPALKGVSSPDLPAAFSDVGGPFVDVPPGKKLALCRVERDDKNQIVLRTMAPISAALKFKSSVEA
jgi:hypothetical protein